MANMLQINYLFKMNVNGREYSFAIDSATTSNEALQLLKNDLEVVLDDVNKILN